MDQGFGQEDRERRLYLSAQEEVTVLGDGLNVGRGGERGVKYEAVAADLLGEREII